MTSGTKCPYFFQYLELSGFWYIRNVCFFQHGGTVYLLELMNTISYPFVTLLLSILFWYIRIYSYIVIIIIFLFPGHCLEVTRPLIALRCRRLPRKAYHLYRRHWEARYHRNILEETGSLAKALLSVLLAVWTHKDIPKATMIAAALWRNTLGYLQAWGRIK